METIIAAAITGGLALLGVIITNLAASTKMQSQLEKAQAVTDTKIQALADEVKKHNNFATRMPAVEEQIKGLRGQIEDLKKYHQPN